MKDAAVIGVPDEIAGEVPKAFVVKLKDVTEKELVDYITGKLLCSKIKFKIIC